MILYLVMGEKPEQIDSCSNCKRRMDGEEYLTQVNPPGGYGRPQILICDDCMRLPKYDYWRSEHWPDWPAPRKL